MIEKAMIENFDKLEYHRKVDVLVAIHVMGWYNIVVNRAQWNETKYLYVCTGIDMFEAQGYVPCYSTLLTSAWDIVRKFDYCYIFHSKEFKGGQWECKLRDDSIARHIGEKDGYYAWAETEQLAICYAGLKAVGFDLKGFLQEEGK